MFPFSEKYFSFMMKFYDSPLARNFLSQRFPSDVFSRMALGNLFVRGGWWKWAGKMFSLLRGTVSRRWTVGLRWKIVFSSKHWTFPKKNRFAWKSRKRFFFFTFMHGNWIFLCRRAYFSVHVLGWIILHIIITTFTFLNGITLTFSL